MFTVGLTGGIGSGKSTVADCFAARGVPIIDTDVLARESTASESPALEAIRATFGESVMRADGTLDRAALRRRVFSDVDSRHQLEAILHPLIRHGVERARERLTAPYVLIVIPLLVETAGYRDLLDRILVVDCSEDLQIVRVMARSGLDRDEVEAILAAQAGRADRLAVADDVIDNSGTPEDLDAQVASLHQRYQTLGLGALP
ncbi:MAG: dephospho-CoA kinase [Thiobacillus sp.]|nr:dephospho-CoA kinase [Thiobacillus sp.]